MLKRFLLAIGFLFVSTNCIADDLKNYVIKVDGKEISINIGETKIIKDNNGKEVKISLEKNKFSSFRDGLIYFEYNSDFAVTKVIQDDLHQFNLINPVGSSIFVQRFNSINKSDLRPVLLDMVLQQFNVSEENKNRENTNLKLIDNNVLDCLEQKFEIPIGKANAKSCKINIDNQQYMVTTFTFQDDEGKQKNSETNIVNLFWKTFKLSK